MLLAEGGLQRARGCIPRDQASHGLSELRPTPLPILGDRLRCTMFGADHCNLSCLEVKAPAGYFSFTSWLCSIRQISLPSGSFFSCKSEVGEECVHQGSLKRHDHRIRSPSRLSGGHNLLCSGWPRSWTGFSLPSPSSWSCLPLSKCPAPLWLCPLEPCGCERQGWCSEAASM